jgi:hypothetical protein
MRKMEEIIFFNDRIRAKRKEMKMNYPAILCFYPIDCYGLSRELGFKKRLREAVAAVISILLAIFCQIFVIYSSAQCAVDKPL